MNTPRGLANYTPIQHKERVLTKNPESAAAHAGALHAVLLHLLADTFDLREEEVLWVSYNLDKTLSSLLDITPHSVPFACRQEMLDGTYTRLLELRGKSHLTRSRSIYDENALQATLEEWVDTLMAPIVTSYNLRALVEATMRGQFKGLLIELGVGDLSNPRGATHIPIDLRNRIFTDRSKTS
jgi:hypothetical protein